MPGAKLIVNATGLDYQFRLIPKDDIKEEGQLDDDSDSNVSEEENQSAAVGGDEAVGESNSNNDRENDSKNEESSKNGHDVLVKKPAKKLSKISLFEMQSFLVALLLPEPRLSTPPSWCRVVRCMRASNVGIFLLDNVDLDWIDDKASKFTHAFRFEDSPNWIEQLTNIPLSRRLQSLAPTPNIFRTADGGREYEDNLNARPMISRTSLLLSPIQMIAENYPMPTDDEISLLRSRYKPVTDRSPMFAIDCEMCITNRSELTKISIVDEELRAVYDVLVKPELPITNYLTRYSGITKDMMENVTTTIEDVQEYMRQKLPRDSIFVGHSLNMDLAALQIFHPYVIDTSVIYNRTGTRTYKPSLKSLAYELMGKKIQSAEMLGHDSFEDAITAMELVKLKLINGIVFGDSVAYEKSQGIKYDQKTGITHLQFDKFIERHNVTRISYRCIDTTPGARCVYIHDKQKPLEQEVKDAVTHLLEKNSAICVLLSSSGECYVKI